MSAGLVAKSGTPVSGVLTPTNLSGRLGPDWVVAPLGRRPSVARVLVVDDDEETRKAFRLALELDGYEVSEAANGQVALDNLRASPVPVVVVLDMVMSPIDGIEFLTAVQADAALASRHCYMVVTALPLDRLALPDDLNDLLAVPPISKPFDLDELLHAVARAAGKLPTSQSGSGIPPSGGSFRARHH